MITRSNKIRNQIFYGIKPFIPRRLQLFLRRKIVYFLRYKYKNVWPIDPVAAAVVPKNWNGWPDQKRFAFVLSHDVDTQKGHDRCIDLMNIEEKLGFKSSFNFVAERYKVSLDLLKEIAKRGNEVCIHGIKHDGKLFRSKKIFDQRAQKINDYINSWNIQGFTAPSMICKLDWIHQLNIKHSTCTFDTDPFEPEPSAARTIFPFFARNASKHEFVELPYTLPQDHTLFIIMQEKNINIWKRKLDWIVANGGMALLNTHPDYMNFNQSAMQLEEYSVHNYIDFLLYIKEEYKDMYWHALPKEVAEYLRINKLS